MEDRAVRQAWFKSVILPHEASLRRRVRRMASPDIDVEDIVAEALLRAYTVTDFGRIDKGRPFLFTIARNLLADLARRRAVVSFELMASLDSLELTDESSPPEAAVAARQEVRRLQQIVEAMPVHWSRVLVLRRIDDLSLSEIAAKLGRSVSTVEKHLANAIAYLTESLAEDSSVPQQKRGAPWRSAKDRR